MASTSKNGSSLQPPRHDPADEDWKKARPDDADEDASPGAATSEGAGVARPPTASPQVPPSRKPAADD